jgi:hypothetical protein
MALKHVLRVARRPRSPQSRRFLVDGLVRTCFLIGAPRGEPQNSDPNSSPEFEPGFQESRAAATRPNRSTTRVAEGSFPLERVLEACPDILDYPKGGISSWRDFVVTAALVRAPSGLVRALGARRKQCRAIARPRLSWPPSCNAPRRSPVLGATCAISLARPRLANSRPGPCSWR